MTDPTDDRSLKSFNLVQGGAIDRLNDRLGLAAKTARRRLLKVAMLVLVTWLPLLLLSFVAGNAFRHRESDDFLPFLHDPEVQARFLIVLPLLELAEVIVAVGLTVQVKHLREMGVVPERERGRFDAARAEALAMRGSAWAEGVILVLAFCLSLVIREVVGVSEGTAASWDRAGSSITLAGWWLMLVSLPLLYFFIFRWLWIFLIWARFLFKVSRLDLELTPTHPDRTGGLGFLGWGLASFATVLLAISTVFSAAFAQEILHHGESLASLKYHVIAFIAVALLVLHLPLLAFSGRLSRCRFSGLLEFGAFVWRYDRAFEAKWLENPATAPEESLLGSADIQSLADIATCYDHIDRMWPMPFDTKAFAVLVLAAMVPMIPLVGTAVPLQEIFMKLGELLI
jgi:hypothetical protein